jgi:hypothetical protein
MWAACTVANRLAGDERDIVTPATIDPYGLMIGVDIPTGPPPMPYRPELLKALQEGKVPVV